jgi:predicted nucleic acid-binding protein
MSKVFLDTSYLLALELTRDQNHAAAVQHWQSIAQLLPSFVTTSYVFDEVVTYFNSRRQHEKAVQVGKSLLLSPSVEFVHVDQPLFHEGWECFRQHQDKDYSLTDCISFIVMKQLSAEVAFTFDGHFAQAGYKKAP